MDDEYTSKEEFDSSDKEGSEAETENGGEDADNECEDDALNSKSSKGRKRKLSNSKKKDPIEELELPSVPKSMRTVLPNNKGNTNSKSSCEDSVKSLAEEEVAKTFSTQGNL